jgi:hypothetical protein
LFILSLSLSKMSEAFPVRVQDPSLSGIDVELYFTDFYMVLVRWVGVNPELYLSSDVANGTESIRYDIQKQKGKFIEHIQSILQTPTAWTLDWDCNELCYRVQLKTYTGLPQCYRLTKKLP